MKTTKFTYWLVFALATTFAATGCKHKPVDVTNLPGRRPPAIGNPTPLDTGSRVQPEPGPTGGTPLPDFGGNIEDRYNLDRAALAAHIVHFAFDSSAVKSSEKQHVEAVASYMKGSATALLIEGHCDERGTEEYNRSLGERRALALREALMQMGVDANRVTTRSWGEDKPAAQGHDESAWQQNRRGEFVVLHPK